MPTDYIETDRLVLRRFAENDAAALLLLLSNKKVTTFLPMFSLKDINEASIYLRKNYLDHYANDEGFYYAVCLKHDNNPVGYVTLKEDESHDLGYGLQADLWGKGIITEACQGIIEMVKKFGISYITATHDINNPNSGNVMRKIGMTYKYTFEELWKPKEIMVSFRMYQLNIDIDKDFIYAKYWNKSPVRYIEEFKLDKS